MIYAYERISTGKQDYDNQKFEIERYAAAHNLLIDEHIEEIVSGTKDYKSRKLGELLERMERGDLLICTEISRLGRSLYMVFDVLRFMSEQGIALQTIKDGYKLDDSIQAKVLAFAFGLSAEIERSLISQRTKEALDKKRAEGVQLGRKRGSRNAKVKLTDDEPAIRSLLAHGCNYSQIARLLECDRTTLMRYVTTRCLELAPKNRSHTMPDLPQICAGNGVLKRSLRESAQTM